MSSQYDLHTVADFSMPNTFGITRHVTILVNGFGRYTWRIDYPENPEAYPLRTDSYFDTAQAARRSARRCCRNLAQ